MILDKATLFSNNQAIAATGTSVDALDFGVGGFGKSTPPYLSVFMDGFGGTGNITVGVEIAESADFATGKRIIASFPLDNRTMKAGGQALRTGIPAGNWRYMRLQYTVGGTITEGKITAGLTM